MNEVTPEIIINRTFKNGGVLTKEESESFPGINVKQYPAGVPLAMVVQGTSVTKNTGNFCSVRTHVQVSMPCVVEEIRECFDACQRFVEERLSEQVAIIDMHIASQKR